VAWTEPQDWKAGDSVTAALLNSNLSANENELYHLIAVQSADVTRNNSAVLTDLTGLSFAVTSGEVWVFFCAIYFSSAATPDVKHTVTAPAATTGRFGLISYGTPLTAASNATYGGNVARTVQNSAADVTLITGTLTAGANGTVQVQGAQNTATASDTTFNKGSFIVAWRKS